MNNGFDVHTASLLDTKAEVRLFWFVPWEFAVHPIVGTLIFTIIAGAATILDLFLHRLEGLGVSVSIIIGLKLGEYGLLLADPVKARRRMSAPRSFASTVLRPTCVPQYMPSNTPVG